MMFQSIALRLDPGFINADWSHNFYRHTQPLVDLKRTLSIYKLLPERNGFLCEKIADYVPANHQRIDKLHENV